MGGKTTIVHAADVHLETAFTDVRGGARRRAALADAFVRIVDLALERSADALTIGGDLYEAERAGPQTARFVFAQLARFGGPLVDGLLAVFGALGSAPAALAVALLVVAW